MNIYLRTLLLFILSFTLLNLKAQTETKRLNVFGLTCVFPSDFIKEANTDKYIHKGSGTSFAFQEYKNISFSVLERDFLNSLAQNNLLFVDSQTVFFSGGESGFLLSTKMELNSNDTLKEENTFIRLFLFITTADGIVCLNANYNEKYHSLVYPVIYKCFLSIKTDNVK